MDTALNLTTLFRAACALKSHDVSREGKMRRRMASAKALRQRVHHWKGSTFPNNISTCPLEDHLLLIANQYVANSRVIGCSRTPRRNPTTCQPRRIPSKEYPPQYQRSPGSAATDTSLAFGQTSLQPVRSHTWRILTHSNLRHKAPGPSSGIQIILRC